MKKIKSLMSSMVIFALILTSCSKEEAGVITNDSEKVQLTFGALLNSFDQQNKQADAGECRENAVPAYVMIGVSTDANVIPTANQLIRVGLKNNNGSWETMYSEDLTRPAGTYYLQHFVVYDAMDRVLWVAPREGGSFAGEVGDALPITINLVAGTKPYIDVDVLCYIAREETAYGYPFFDFDVIEVENSYCIFVNYCDDETGREYPAYFTVQLFEDAGRTQPIELANNTNTIEVVNGWPSASVLCIPLPDLGDGTVYARVTVTNHDDLDYTADATDYHDFEITQASIDAQELFIPAYHHVRINCSPGGGPGDPVCDTDVRCELNLENDLDPNCDFTAPEGAVDGWVRITSEADLQLLSDLGAEGSVALSSANISLSGNDVTITLDTPIDSGDRITAYAIEIRPGSGDSMNPTCWESKCANVVSEYGSIANEFSGFNYEYPFYVKINTITCYTRDL